MVFWKICLFTLVLKHMDSLQVSDGESVDKVLNPFSLSFAMQESLSDCISFSFLLCIFAFVLCFSYFRPSYYQITNSFLFLSFKFLHAPLLYVSHTSPNLRLSTLLGPHAHPLSSSIVFRFWWVVGTL